MRVGINVPLKAAGSDHPLDAAGVATRAKMIEDAGFDGIWMGDSTGFMRPDSLMWLLTAANATTTVEVGTCIYIAAVRNPYEMVQRFTTLHTLTNGRFSVGVGAGSGRQSHEIMGLDFDDRFHALHDKIARVKEIASEPPPPRARRAGANPAPQATQSEAWGTLVGLPRFILGAWHSEISLKRAVADYDGWMCSAGRTNFNTMAEAIKRYRDLGGKRAMISTCLVDLEAPTTKITDDDPYYLQCAPEDAAERLARLVELGFDDILLVKSSRANPRPLFEPDFTADDLEQIRSLVPRDPTSPLTAS